jgi:hypothetical protein
LQRKPSTTRDTISVHIAMVILKEAFSKQFGRSGLKSQSSRSKPIKYLGLQSLAQVPITSTSH